MKLQFTKMHGAGNDYIYLDCRESGLPDQVGNWAKALSRRHFSVGADGIICICPPLLADGDATMRMFNSDGSEGMMCGNGVRCVAQYLYTHGVQKEELRIDTPAAGRRTLHRTGDGQWQADMGRFSAMAADLPAVGLGSGPLIGMPLIVDATRWEVSCISMGNPHCVVPVAALPNPARLAVWGPLFERHPAFPEGVNTEFVVWQDANHIAMRVWERGSGETLACGTGACAALAALVLCGACPRDVPVEVATRGGPLTVQIKPDDTVLLGGPAREVFTGIVEV